MNDSIITRYRPEGFDEVLGQDLVVKAVEAAIAKKVGKAWLFVGPFGTGKTTLARLTAAALGVSPANLQEVDAASKTGIDDMRDVIADLQYMPLGAGASKGVIIDECHGLSKAAITSLLKILEQPPEHVYWFLCTTEPTKVPAPIKSRCLSFQLKEIRTDDLIDLLESTEEAKQVPKDVVALCAREAHGSARQALANLGACMAAETRAEAAELLRTATDAPAAFDLARALMNGDDWIAVRGILLKLKETSSESIRHVVRAYMTKVALEPKGEKGGDRALAVLAAFDTPFPSSDGISPVVIACARLSR